MEPETPWAFRAKTLSRKTTHGVQLETIKHCLARYEKNVTPADLMDVQNWRRKDGKDAGKNNSTSIEPLSKPKDDAQIQSSPSATLPPKEKHRQPSLLPRECVIKTTVEALTDQIARVDLVDEPKIPDGLVDYDSSDYESADEDVPKEALVEQRPEVQSPRALLLERNLDGFLGYEDESSEARGRENQLKDTLEESEKDSSEESNVAAKEIRVSASLNLPYSSDSENDASEGSTCDSAPASSGSNSDSAPASSGSNSDSAPASEMSNSDCTPTRKAISTKSIFSKPRLDESLKNSLLAENRWDFPVFPGGISAAEEESLHPLPPLVTVKRESRESGTLTDPDDFNFLRQTLEIADLGPNNRVILNDYLIVGAKARIITTTTEETLVECGSSISKSCNSFSKSCSVDNEIGEDAILLGAVMFLKECFPNCRADLLENILEKCDGDTELAVEVIVNLGYDDVEEMDDPFGDFGGGVPPDVFGAKEILDVDVGKNAENVSVKKIKTTAKKPIRLEVKPTSLTETLRRLTLNDDDGNNGAGSRKPEKHPILQLETPLLHSLQEKYGMLAMSAEQSVQYLQGCGLSLELDDHLAELLFQFLRIGLSSSGKVEGKSEDEEETTLKSASCENDAVIARLLGHEGTGDKQEFNVVDNNSSNDLRQIMEEEKIIRNKVRLAFAVHLDRQD